MVGLILSALGGLWYWRITKIAAGFVGTTVSASMDKTARFAIGLVCFGLIVSLAGIVINFSKRDDAA